MKRDDILGGDIITFSNGCSYTVVVIGCFKHIMNTLNYKVGASLKDLCDSNLLPKDKSCSIIEIHRHGELIWTKPIEMTIAEIEKALKLTPGSLRIKD